MALDESRFTIIADQVIADLSDTLDDQIGDEADVDLQGGILTIALESGGQFIINKNAPVRQIWLSSPLSGAWHFSYDETDQRWRASKDSSVVLHTQLEQDLSQATGQKVRLA